MDLQCHLCSYIASSANVKRVHIESVHIGIKYDCRECDKS